MCNWKSCNQQPDHNNSESNSAGKCDNSIIGCRQYDSRGNKCNLYSNANQWWFKPILSMEAEWKQCGNEPGYVYNNNTDRRRCGNGSSYFLCSMCNRKSCDQQPDHNNGDCNP